MTFIDLFAGIGGFRRGLELAGHKCVGFCEWDKYATASYTAMHLITEEQRKYLETLDKKQRVKEILKEEYRNGDWYSADIRLVNAGNVPRCDCWCFGAPCQDFSVAGKRAGLDGDRSSLVREVFRVLGELEEDDRPEWLIYENVKGMLSSNGGRDYLAILLEMDELGYDAEWFNFNSKYHGVPQNRERVYTIGHFRGRGPAKVFPLKGADGEDSVEGMNPECIGGFGEHKSNGGTQDYQQDRIYDSETVATAHSANIPGGANKYAVRQIGECESERNNPNQYRVYEEGGQAPSLNTMGGGGREPHIIVMNEPEHQWQTIYNPAGGSGLERERLQRRTTGCFAIDKNRSGEERDVANTLTAREDRGVSEQKQTGTAVVLKIRGGCRPGMYVELSNGAVVYAVWYPKYECYVAIRKLTPRECFRLQGWTDDYFDKAELVNSDSQLYKQAGNGVTVNVVEVIGKRLREIDDGR